MKTKFKTKNALALLKVMLITTFLFMSSGFLEAQNGTSNQIFIGAPAAQGISNMPALPSLTNNAIKYSITEFIIRASELSEYGNGTEPIVISNMAFMINSANNPPSVPNLTNGSTVDNYRVWMRHTDDTVLAGGQLFDTSNATRVFDSKAINFATLALQKGEWHIIPFDRTFTYSDRSKSISIIVVNEQNNTGANYSAPSFSYEGAGYTRSNLIRHASGSTFPTSYGPGNAPIGDPRPFICLNRDTTGPRNGRTFTAAETEGFVYCMFDNQVENAFVSATRFANLSSLNYFNPTGFSNPSPKGIFECLYTLNELGENSKLITRIDLYPTISTFSPTSPTNPPVAPFDSTVVIQIYMKNVADGTLPVNIPCPTLETVDSYYASNGYKKVFDGRIAILPRDRQSTLAPGTDGLLNSQLRPGIDLVEVKLDSIFLYNGKDFGGADTNLKIVFVNGGAAQGLNMNAFLGYQSGLGASTSGLYRSRRADPGAETYNTAWSQLTGAMSPSAKHTLRLKFQNSSAIETITPVANNYFSKVDLASNNRPGLTLVRKDAVVAAPEKITYKITRLATNEVVYQAKTGSGGSDTMTINAAGLNVRYNISYAEGVQAGTNGQFKMADPIPAEGEYEIEVCFYHGFTNRLLETYKHTFTIEMPIVRYRGIIPNTTMPINIGGVAQHPSVSVIREVSAADPAKITYKIYDPSNRLVYTGYDERPPYDTIIVLNNDIIGQESRCYIGNADGDIARAGASINTSNLVLGRYTIKVSFDDGHNPIQQYEEYFDVVVDSDLELIDVVAPKASSILADAPYYPIGLNIPIEFEVKNSGVRTIKSFGLTAKIYRAATNALVDEIEYIEDGLFDSITAPNIKHIITTSRINTTTLGVGDYYIVCEIFPIDPARDDDSSNNVWPLAGRRYFQVGPEYDVTIDGMSSPFSTSYRYPMYPVFTVSNKNSIEVNGSRVNLKIEHNGNVVYDASQILANIGRPTPSGRSDSIRFSQLFFPMEVGNYQATLTLDLHGNPASRTFNFTVEAGMSGVYTIGGTTTAGRNFANFRDALNALYERGVSGNVVFELTNSTYIFRENESSIPDFRSKIIGVGSNATVTFRPSPELMTAQNPIELHIFSSSGYGIRFGQGLLSNNTAAAVNVIREERLIRQELANSDGYIIFDGGNRKNINIIISDENITSDNKSFSAPIYLGSGSNNITIKNCRIETTTTQARNAISIPYMQYVAGVPEFSYQRDVDRLSNNTTLTYSAGVVVRNSPLDALTLNNHVFTANDISSNNNVIEGNIIKGFGYGIVSIGRGAVIRDGLIVPMYNENNRFENNYIRDISKSGIFLGYELNSKIAGNRIDNVNTSAGITSSNIATNGIEIGRKYVQEAVEVGDIPYLSYSNVGVNVEKNEISNIISDAVATGVFLVQPSDTIISYLQRFVFPPNDNGDFLMTNNLIYSINSKQNLRAGRYGISISPDKQNFDMNKYRINNVKIINNTILLTDTTDIDLPRANEAVAGILAYDVNQFDIYNNAITVKISPTNRYNYVSALSLRGMNPSQVKNQNLNNNSYYIDTTNNITAAVVHFVEIDRYGRELGDSSSECYYVDLAQWINWTSADRNSVYYDFSNDMKDTNRNITPNITYQVKRMTNSNRSSHSMLLYNRGLRIISIATDIDNASRFSGDVGFNIGAIEFSATSLLADVEVRRIVSPAAYRNNLTMFNDAEYVMVKKAPVEVRAIVRNNGQMYLPSIPLICEITPGNGMESHRDSIAISLASGEEREVLFFDSSDSSRVKFVPDPLYLWANKPDADDKYVTTFTSMQTTVTPVYTVTVGVHNRFGQDMNKANDTIQKNVRFYVSQTNSPAHLNLLISGKNISANLYDENNAPLVIDRDIIAGKLNYDTVVKAFNNLGYFLTTGEGIHNFDVFDRNAWEPRSVNYSLYNGLLWADAHEDTLTYWEKQSLIDFANAGNPSRKTTLIAASQEMVRANNNVLVNGFDAELQSAVIRSSMKGNGVYSPENNIQIKGYYVNQDFVITVARTSYGLDMEPVPGAFLIKDTMLGQNYVAYHYHPLSNTDRPRDNISVLSSKMLTRHLVYAAIDWRHFTNATAFLSGILNEVGKDLQDKDGINAQRSLELVDFTAKAMGRKVILDWATAAEINTKDFDIERASIFNSNVGIFNKIGSENALGFNNSRNYYNAIDNNVTFDQKYAYRLKINNFDGEYSYSPIRFVNIEYASGVFIDVPSPNPSSDLVRVNYSLPTESAVKITLFDLSGREVLVYEGTKSAGANFIEIDVRNLSAGAYNLQFIVDGQIVEKTTTINVIQ